MRRPHLPPKPAAFRLFQKTFYHDATRVPDQSIPRTAARLAYNADLIVVAPSPHWRCNDVRRALAVALHVRTSPDAAQIVLLLPSHGAEVDEHTCAGQAGAEMSQHVDLLLSWTHQRTLASLRAAPSGVLKPHACLRSAVFPATTSPIRRRTSWHSPGRTSSLRCPRPRPCRPHTMRFGWDSAPVRLLLRGRGESPQTYQTSSATIQRMQYFFICLHAAGRGKCVRPGCSRGEVWCTHGVRDRCPTPSAPEQTAAAVVAEFRVTHPG